MKERDELCLEAEALRAAIFAYEMTGMTHRIDAASARLREVYATIREIDAATPGGQ